ncbi:hypothetical protein EIP86_008780 [Pleurotus ostreatoroseus]|nr:hypothetical protein EIP86_008780 [Pleurotus ostreatoroseus]
MRGYRGLDGSEDEDAGEDAKEDTRDAEEDAGGNYSRRESVGGAEGGRATRYERCAPAYWCAPRPDTADLKTPSEAKSKAYVHANGVGGQPQRVYTKQRAEGEQRGRRA